MTVGDDVLEALTTRVARLEGLIHDRRHHVGEADQPPAHRSENVGQGDSARRWWVLDRLTSNVGPRFERAGVSGSVVYGGITATPGAGDIVWQAEHAACDVLDADLSRAARVLAALGHQVRLEIVRQLLTGAHTMAQLAQIPGIGTAGQLHHHLRELRSAGIVRHSRNHYTVVAELVVPSLVMIAAAAGPALAGVADRGPESTLSVAPPTVRMESA